MAVPVGFSEATLVWQAVGALREATWQIGISDFLTPAENPTVIAQTVYDAAVLPNSITPALKMSTEWTFLGVRAFTQQEVGPLTGEFMQTVTGTATNLTPVMNTAVLVRKNTALGGRRNRGRLYHPPILVNEANVNTLGVLSAAARDNIQAGFNIFLDAIDTALYKVNLYHQSPPFTPTPVNSFSVQQLLATQRRRLRK